MNSPAPSKAFPGASRLASGEPAGTRVRSSWTVPDMFAQSPAAWPFGDLEAGAYSLIMADPPWRFELYSVEGEEKSAQGQYATMGLDEIAALPVADLARAAAVLWLWATAPMLPQQLAVMAAWGFTFKTSGVWVKRTKHGKVGFGTGYVLRNAHEPFLIGTRGAPRTSRSVRSVIEAGLREHSRKPEEAFAAAEQLMPGQRRCELFSRARRACWDTWGHEAGKFDAEGAR